MAQNNEDKRVEPNDLADELVGALADQVETQKDLAAELNNLAQSLDELRTMIEKKLRLPTIAGRLFGKTGSDDQG